MMAKFEKLKLKKLLCEAIALLCRSQLAVLPAVHIEALIGITLNDDEVLLISFNENMHTSETLPNSEVPPQLNENIGEQIVKRVARASKSITVGEKQDFSDSNCSVEPVNPDNCSSAEFYGDFSNNISVNEQSSDGEQTQRHTYSDRLDFIETIEHKPEGNFDFNQRIQREGLKPFKVPKNAISSRVGTGQWDVAPSEFSVMSRHKNNSSSAVNSGENSFPPGNVKVDTAIDDLDSLNTSGKESNVLAHWDNHTTDLSAASDNVTRIHSARQAERSNSGGIFIKEEINDGALLVFHNSTEGENNASVSSRVKRGRKQRRTSSYRESPYPQDESSKGAHRMQESMFAHTDPTAFDVVNSSYDLASAQVPPPAESDLNMYQCQICCAQLRGRRTLYEHVRGTHLCVHTYQCPFCGVSFKWRSGLKRHRLKCHLAPR